MIEEIKEAQKEAEDMVSLKVEATAGVKDVIGIEVLSLNGNIKTEEDAKKYIKESTEESFGIIEVEGQLYAVKTTVSDLNKVNMVDPTDLDAKQAIPIQIKISEMLEKSGLEVKVNKEKIENAENTENAQQEVLDTCESGSK